MSEKIMDQGTFDDAVSMQKGCRMVGDWVESVGDSGRS